MSSGEAIREMMVQVLSRQAENGDSAVPELAWATLAILLFAGLASLVEIGGNKPDDAP